MMFSSKTPRDLNRDPEPWVAKPQFRPTIGQPKHHAAGVDCSAYCVREPRAEFDHVQHNEPHPILTTLRLNCNSPETDGWDARIAALYFLEQAGIDNIEPEQASPAQVEHARRVLVRLAALPHIPEES